MSILLTGGAGYIGSHTALALIQAGLDVVLVDNFINSSPHVLGRIEAITEHKPPLIEADVCDKEALRAIFREYPISAVIHFAGHKAVGESVRIPLCYYRNNLDSALSVLEVMQEFGCKQFVFSSSATVYGDQPSPLTEACPTGSCTNPYGWTKFMIEQIVQSTSAADPDFSAVILRYFNPVGAHPSGLMGEDPSGEPNNLMPYLAQVASKKRDHLTVFSNDYPTPDGTGVRDYIHIMDLAEGHLAAVRYAEANTGCEIFNLGTGRGYSVLEMIETFASQSGQQIAYIIGERRAGDLAAVFADPTKAAQLLGWTAQRDLAQMCKDTWNWQQKNPNGYRE